MENDREWGILKDVNRRNKRMVKDLKKGGKRNMYKMKEVKNRERLTKTKGE